MRSSFFWDFTQRRIVVTDVSGEPICTIFESSVILTIEDGPEGLSRNVSKELQTFRDNLSVPFSRVQWPWLLKWDRWVVLKRRQFLDYVSGQTICTIFKSTVTLTHEDGPDGLSRIVGKELQTFRETYLYNFQAYSNFDPWKWDRWIVTNRRLHDFFFWFNWKNLRNIDGIFTSNFYMIFSDLIKRIYVILTEFLQVISTWFFLT